LALIIAGSTWNERILRAHGIVATTTVLQGVDASLFHPAPRSGAIPHRFVVFSGGKLEFRKGQDLVLAAFRAFRQRHPEALLLTAWSSPWSELTEGAGCRTSPCRTSSARRTSLCSPTAAKAAPTWLRWSAWPAASRPSCRRTPGTSTCWT
jgi:glycosyltransferase involved in cell wall biosynthesis